MQTLADCRTVAPADLREAAARLRADGWRLITASSIRHPAGTTVLFHFERDELLCHLRVQLGPGVPLPAIDGSYPAAFLVENEMAELQGVRVDGLSIDYGGRLFRDFGGTEGVAFPLEPASGDGDGGGEVGR